jgi:hypothetical protein
MDQSESSKIRLEWGKNIIFMEGDGLAISGKYADWLESTIATLRAERDGLAAALVTLQKRCPDCSGSGYTVSYAEDGFPEGDPCERCDVQPAAILAAHDEALTRPLRERCAGLEGALKMAFFLPRPWMASGLPSAKAWCKAVDVISDTLANGTPALDAAIRKAKAEGLREAESHIRSLVGRPRSSVSMFEGQQPDVDIFDDGLRYAVAQIGRLLAAEEETKQ